MMAGSGALNNGVTVEELQEIFLHASVCCGFPAAVDAFRNAAEVIESACPCDARVIRAWVRPR